MGLIELPVKPQAIIKESRYMS
ncbi:uncharacterized protein G2W53_023673 [Senna tora]|uniref:Uncharacterized protein n=1 Tax=Senna tora TaxID=362788 RepID=A0A834T9X7_9FABA|nr:uncharacterized protein G2W53_023673 [Senna tora]